MKVPLDKQSETREETPVRAVPPGTLGHPHEIRGSRRMGSLAVASPAGDCAGAPGRALSASL